MRFVEGEDAFG